ncbi:DUF4870 domain-containing protein [Natronolimnohabitans sp. A-GB9]|uniref:DUF4870 domain-containing protein n=1 Tax=Natronolimnohabitans sp. A-GB9 TaxID=3069757 RepID=UPI0027B2566F|nr:DUF4870 domain-containing protein [Natronolimnohabitans sp. A-GB9]MDQ2050139.1 DUF4870 domain-containing protein [Natronolimnohabitans sp. A-GB9]
MYAVSDDEFTRENARHALNWHVTVVALVILTATTVLLGADEITVGGAATELSLLPSPVDTVFTVVGLLALLATMVAVFATFAYAVVATLRAISGSVWRYPGAIDVVGRFL